MNRSLQMLLGVVLALAMHSSAFGCAACFGKSDSPMAYGMNAGIISLLAVIVPVLGLIASFFGYIVYRARRVGSESDINSPAV
ncbi:MAG TPA: hypothetical protein PLX89_05015 [Verrucomicrobiota bacterium]|nr:hypothetical protein [Verrucomicrobiales bacterium]HRI12347.1 hypothetical protein [Verrucomicrobiota bacterium]